MTTFTIDTDGDDLTLWRTPGNEFGPEALLREAAVDPQVWAMVALVVELGGSERVRAGVELAAAVVTSDEALAALGAAVHEHDPSDYASLDQACDAANDNLEAALARFREVGTR